MNTFEIEKLAVQQMNANELVQSNGGSKTSIAFAYAGMICACAAGGPVTGAVAVGGLIWACIEHDSN